MLQEREVRDYSELQNESVFSIFLLVSVFALHRILKGCLTT